MPVRDSELSLVFRWSFGTAWLLLNLGSHQSCDQSSNVDHLLVNQESAHEAAGLGWLPPQNSSAMAIGRPPELGRVWSPAPQAESGKIGP